MICPVCNCKESICGYGWERCKNCGYTNTNVVSFMSDLELHSTAPYHWIDKEYCRRGQKALRKVRASK